MNIDGTFARIADNIKNSLARKMKDCLRWAGRRCERDGVEAPTIGTKPRTALHVMYADLLARARDLPAEQQAHLGCPMLPFPDAAWPTAQCRILMVAKEPLNCGYDKDSHVKGGPYDWPHPPLWRLNQVTAHTDSLAALEQGIALPYPDNQGAPVARAVNRLRKVGAVLQTNVSVCAYFETPESAPCSPHLYGPPAYKQQYTAWQRGCLAAQVRLFAPTVVVFFSGPYNDGELKLEFPGLEFEPFNARPTRQLARVNWSLPIPAVRTYHPNALQRLRLWPVMDEIVAFVERTVDAPCPAQISPGAPRLPSPRPPVAGRTVARL
jgi:hypothetical protein